MRRVDLILSSFVVLLSCVSAHSADQESHVVISCKFIPLNKNGLDNYLSKRPGWEAFGEIKLFKKPSYLAPSLQLERLDCSGAADDKLPVIPILKITHQIQKSEK